tara:strand:+ start:1347 stop:2219 length:873 start_codon:yes stop_codon:yes gene_type:complete
MIKMFFAPNWGLTVEQMVNDYKIQTPGNSGIWENITYTLDPSEADYLVIQDNCSRELFEFFSPDRRLYFSREALTPQFLEGYINAGVMQNSFWNGTGILWTKWVYPNRSSGGVHMSYDDLHCEKPVRKSKLISCVQSNKGITAGHQLRKNFLRVFTHRNASVLDLYGSISFANKHLKDNDKNNALEPYKYCLAFDNQDTIGNFFGTQFTDSLLRWCVPIYWGGANLDDYFPKKSFLQIDITSSTCYEEVLDLIENDDYDERLEAVKEARQLILNKYNMWPILQKAVDSNK